MGTLPATPYGMTVADRIVFSCIPDVNGCWIWFSGKNHNGYGVIKLNGKNVLAHRESYRQFRDPIPDNMQIDHLCCVRACVSPGHLQVVTPRQNSHRSTKTLATIYASRTHCTLGHKYDFHNTRHGSDGRRICRKCASLKANLYKKTKRAVAMGVAEYVRNFKRMSS